ncbi:DNA replication protein [[Haemophilus] felis]|nr:DNA replication protein [[Haemophilus] felis]
MELSLFLKNIGRSIAYRPKLAKLFGGATAEIFFEQILYWQDKAENQDLGVYKTQAELEEETGLSRKEQETARQKLRAIGVLIETYKRLEHRIYYKIDMVKLNDLLKTFANVQSELSRMPESDIGDSPKRTFVNTLDYNTRLHTNNNTPLPPKTDNTDFAEQNTLSADADGEGGEKENLPAKQKKSRAGEKINFQAVIDIYNQVNEETGSRLSFVETLNEKRKRGIKKLLAALHEPTLECVESYFRELFNKLRPFHLGEDEKSGSTWRANFDWAIREDTLIKVREDNL